MYVYLADKGKEVLLPTATTGHLSDDGVLTLYDEEHNVVAVFPHLTVIAFSETPIVPSPVEMSP